jgi:hypothetical protein
MISGDCVEVLIESSWARPMYGPERQTKIVIVTTVDGKSKQLWQDIDWGD